VSRPTFILRDRSQQIAIEWLKVNEYRPAMDLLRRGDAVTPELRQALVAWMERGAKRKPGMRVPRDPWKTLPPTLARKKRSSKQDRAEFLFAAFPVFVPAGLAAALGIMSASRSRGRPATLRSRAIDYVAKRLDVSRRTAERWFRDGGFDNSRAYRD
jgi:hypothetical protein